MTDKQFIISIGREFASGGHEIAAELAKRFSLPLYDYNIISEIAGENHSDPKTLERYDEVPRKRAITKTVRGHSSSMAENVAQIQFDYLKNKAASGESFVVVGRCSEEILKEYDGLIPIFILADMDVKIKRIAEYTGMTEAEAESFIKKHGRKRTAYHNYFCKLKWADSRNYDICINSSRLGITGTTDFLENYIKTRIGR